MGHWARLGVQERMVASSGTEGTTEKEGNSNSVEVWGGWWAGDWVKT